MSITSNIVVTVTDSGSGGLTVVQKIRKLAPYVDIVYLADNKYAPYGLKTEHWVRGRSVYIADLLCSYKPAVHVIACNTSTVVSLSTVKSKQVDTVIVGTIDAASDMALAESTTSCIGVISTSLTVATGAYTVLLMQKCSSCQVHELACDSFVKLAETGEWDTEYSFQQIQNILAPWLQRHPDIDTLICGCTHFPFLIKNIQRVCGNNISVIDPAEGIVRKTLSLMPHKLSDSNLCLSGTTVLIASGSENRLLQHACSYLQLDSEQDKYKTLPFTSIEEKYLIHHRGRKAG